MTMFSVVPPTFLAVGIFIKLELQLYFSQAGMQQMLWLAPVVSSLAPLAEMAISHAKRQQMANYHLVTGNLYP